ncbi:MULTISPECIES: IclR family transcriptional regulator [Micromonospora]|uniref:IclR family transcriptional regulator n=1 Tax=Micromonospora TaxID=1873 RepID=UPI00115454E5|nr:MULTISPECIES: IclR family transcriptional regulator [Micromonospora]TQJ23517.1 IclR family transcriptional regulator [Micromonospora sp. A202]MBQ0978682.1 IclR family transcriptional regulator [Micromonospora sp. M61]MBQ1038742.1 IclR family transcriptional regulator [Micromonospora sp. C81]WSK49668.1 IclR family transcriptional regulator [Micromonospora zamorensis]WTE87664.1 IclR family transcriptional regulator [Micromonospora zamorensis]
MAESQGTEAASRVADVLLLFTDGPDFLGVTAIARSLDLSKAVVHRILQTLVERRLLVSDPASRGYQLGPAAAALGARALRESQLRTVAMPVLRELQLATGETATVSAHVHGGRVYLDQVESTREIKMTVEVGRRFPLYAGSSSTCILAFLPDTERESLLATELPSLTNRTVTDHDLLRARLTAIRKTGVANSDGERQEGAGSVASPVFGIDGTVVGAVSVCGPAHRVDEAARERFGPLVWEAADSISRALGWSGGLPK